MVAPKLVGFVIKDHYTGCNERPEFAGVLTRKFVRFGCIGVSITLRRVWLLENMYNRGKEHPMGSQSYWQGDLVGPVGQLALVDRVDSLASLQAGWEVRGESMGAIPEVQVVGRLVDPEVNHPEGQVVDSSQSGQQEVASEEVGRSGWHENLGRNKISGSVVGQRRGVPRGRTHALMVFPVGGYMGRTADTEALEVARKVYVWMGSVRMRD